MLKSCIVVAFFLAASMSSLSAQGESGDAQLRNRCRQFAHYLGMGPKHPHYDEALSGIRRCDESGGAALATVWSKLTAADSDAVGGLEYVSSRLRDHQLLDSLLTQIADASRSRPVRIGMLSVLVSYYAPARVLPSGAVKGVDPGYCMLGWVTDFAAHDGATPVTAADRPHILEVLQALASDDPDPVVRGAVACTAAAMKLASG